MQPIPVSNISFHECGATKSHCKDIAEVTADFALEKPHTFAKAIYTFIDCLNIADWIPEHHQKTASSLRYHTNLVKLSRAPGDLLNNFNILRRKTAEVLSGKNSASDIFDWTRTANNLIGPTTDIADFFTKAILYIPKESIKTLQGFNGASLIYGFGYESYKDLEVVHNSDTTTTTGAKRDKEFTKVVAALLKLANDVSLFVLGVFTVLSIFFAVPISSQAFTIGSAISVVATIIGYYHKNLGTEIQLK